MTRNEIILDTTALLSFYHLNILQELNLLYDIVHIPDAVEKEFLQWNKRASTPEERFESLSEMYRAHSVWFKKCNSYDTDLVMIYSSEKYIHQGEAEVFAQQQAHGNIPMIALDDLRARKLAEKKSLTKVGSLKILAQLHNLGIRPGYYGWVAELQRLGVNNRLNMDLVDRVYREICTPGLN
jgi:predicted nucleic acid-binding protein